MTRELQDDAALGFADEISEALAAHGWPSLETLADEDPQLRSDYLHAFLLPELLNILTGTTVARSSFQL